MGEINTYKDLHACQVGMDTIELTYAVTAHFPNEERYGLVATAGAGVVLLAVLLATSI